MTVESVGKTYTAKRERRMRKISILFCLLSLANLTSAKALKPNVLFIAIDDLNDYVSLLKNYPGIQTPNLDKFSKEAMSFTRAYCAAPVCNPSRTALLSGIAPHKSGVYDNKNKMTKSKQVMDSVLLPEHFKANGYVTQMSGKIFHSKPETKRWNAMWDDLEGFKGQQPKVTVKYIPKSIRRPPLFDYQSWEGPDTDFYDVKNMLIAKQRLQKTYQKPFFMALGIHKPHNPWTAPKRFFELYPLDEITMPEILEGDLDDVPAIGKQFAHNPVSFKQLREAGHWRPVVQSYLACISFMDYVLGQVLDDLAASPHADNTIVCLWADHGFHMGEKEHFAKYALWELTTRCLMIWKVPGMTDPNTICERPVNLLDLYPTLIDLCDLSKTKQTLDGQSIRPLLEDPDIPWERPSMTTYQKGNHAVRDERYRYIRYKDGTEELYDHTTDPHEWTNLAGDPGLTEVKTRLRKWIPIMQ